MDQQWRRRNRGQPASVGPGRIQKTGNWTLPFKVSIGVILLGAILSFTMHPERQFSEEAPPVAAGSGR